MVIVKLMGGLGNQMFQYALGRQLSQTLKVPLKLDLSYFYKENYHPEETIRHYELGVFNIEESFASPEEIADFMIEKPKELFPKLFFQIKRAIVPKRIVRERFFHFDPQILSVKSPSYLEGYWQTFKYFENIDSIIRKEFSFKKNPDSRVLEQYQKIQSVNSVSIHIRRGDYVAFKSVNAYHGVCSLEYYEKAISLISKKVKDPVFFIFSDEINWAKENIKINGPHHFIDNDASVPACEDLRLMSKCKHQIIANSSFSWWAAWLNDWNGKIVVAPHKWFNEESKDTKDIIPQNWIRI